MRTELIVLKKLRISLNCCNHANIEAIFGSTENKVSYRRADSDDQILRSTVDD